MTNREEDRIEKMKSLLIEAKELIKKSDSTDDDELEEEYFRRARELYDAYEKMKAESEPDTEVSEEIEEDLSNIGLDELTISEIRYLSRLLGVSMERTVRVLLSAALNHTLKAAFEPSDGLDAGQKLEFMQISGVSPESVRKALEKMTSDEI